MSEKEDTPFAETTAEAISEALEVSVATEEIQIDPTGRCVDPPSGEYHWATGRRKSAVARVRMRAGSGQYIVNGKPMSEFFTRTMDQAAVSGPLECLGIHKKMDIIAQVQGGGPTGQAGAVRLGLGRALLVMYPDALHSLRTGGHLTRDPRMVERKKYGLHGARRGHQWGKR